MTVSSLASWALGRRSRALPLSPVREARVDAGLTRQLGWAAPAVALLATSSAAGGALLHDRPTAFGGVLFLAAVAMVAWLSREISARVLVRMNVALAEREALDAELALACRAKEEFRDLAYHDALTGMHNRSLLYDRLGLAITHSQRQASQIAVLFLDLDDFKIVNDSFGHAAGDRLLIEFAARVRSSVRAGDTVARFGGDEFVVLLDSVAGREDAERVATKVREVVRAPFRLDGPEVSITMSVGVSVYPGDGTCPAELVSSADAAMYRNKQLRQPVRAVAARLDEPKAGD